MEGISVIAELLQEIGRAILKQQCSLLQIDPALIILPPVPVTGTDSRVPVHFD